jgi:hypothetical protein
MTIAEGASLAGLAITALGGLGWLGSLTWHGGRQAQKLDNAASDIRDLKTKQDEHATSIAAWSQALSLLEEVRGDVKSLMTGRARRNSGTGD